MKTRGGNDYDSTQIKYSVHACCKPNEKCIFRKHSFVQVKQVIVDDNVSRLYLNDSISLEKMSVLTLLICQC